ncbi:hypothetical protein B1A87_005280 [Arthrobacter sp. KBS0703]|uniref:hypothetical protein n=1 Tax=Arthrobacter sp. KBS0703 TaxID=1955698 RepID=UPI00098E9AE4|nr:hypothetical protein [Arthrobacter sp. KBS0703]TSE15409.1 hypothetical protein B1A87_005280 [Arthrobacter sp. KBS0703]
MLAETKYLIETYGIKTEEWAAELAGQALSLATFDPCVPMENAPKDATDGADFIVNHIPNCLRYNAETSTWYVWNGVIHKPLSGNTVPTQLIDTLGYAFKDLSNFIESWVRFKANEAKKAKDPEAAQYEKDLKASTTALIAGVKDYARSLNSNRGVKDTLEKLSRAVAVDADFFGDDRQWFVVRNGVFDMEEVRATKQWTLKKHEPWRPVYRMWDIADAPGADYPHLKKFLGESIADDGQARFFSKAVALACMGSPVSTKTLVSLQGETNSGKSMINRVVKRLAKGADTVVAPPRDAIVAGARKPEHARYKMRRGRYVAFSEIRVALDTEFVLQYTGGDDYDIEEKFIASSTVAPQGIIFMASNKGTQVDKTDAAMFSRIAPVNFPHTFVKGIDETENLEDLIVAEGSGFLEWMKWSYLTYLEEGLDKTDSMEALKREEREADSTALQFVDAQIEANLLRFQPTLPKSRSILLTNLHESYVRYCMRHAIQPKDILKKKDFRKHLEVRYEVDNTAGYRVYGLAHTTPAESMGNFVQTERD